MKKFFKDVKKPLITLLILLVCVFGCMSLADGIQKSFGKVEVTTQTMVNTDHPEDEIVYKLYKPASATATNKAPAVLLLHGYQNDHETDDAYAIELSRRGVVVMAIDEYGHGKTQTSMIDRGYVNHKVSWTYGTKQDGQDYVEISGQYRYKLLMNFSNLSFFLDKYSKDSDGNSVVDSSMGGIVAYANLASLPYVDNTKLGISGHSMGTWASWSVAAAYSGTEIMPKATILQCGELFTKDAYDSENIKFNNVLLLTAVWDEFNYFRDYEKTSVQEAMIKSDLNSEFLGVNKDLCEWNKTFGNFGDGTARRRELLKTNHRLTTHNHSGLKTSLDWFNSSLGFKSTIDNSKHVFQYKGLLVLVSMFAGIASMFALLEILLKKVPFFAKCVQKLPVERDSYRVKTGWKWWKGAIITILISGLTYPFMTQLGHGLLPLPEGVFRMTIGNGFLSWYGLLILVMLGTTIIPFIKSKKKEVPMDYVDLGMARPEHSKKFDWALLGKMALLASLMALFMYAQVVLCEAIFQLDFRYIWPFFKGFTFERVGQFFVYILIFVTFFILNNSKIFAQMRNKDMATPGFVGFVKCWWKNALCMVGGVLLLILLEYIPFFIGAGPGADLLFGSTFGGPFMSLMIVFVPQVIVFSVLCTYSYRRTGNIFLGGTLVAIMACWIVTGGSAIL